MSFFNTKQGQAFIDVATELFKAGEPIPVSGFNVRNEDIEDVVKSLVFKGETGDIDRKAVTRYLKMFELVAEKNAVDMSKFTKRTTA